MFERFTEPARRVVVLAQETARERGADRIRSEHLLLGLCRVTDAPGAALLAERGVTPDAVERDLGAPPPDGPDPAALATLGIDLDAVREQVDRLFGPGTLDSTRAARGRRARRGGHIRFAPEAKKVLELSLREAIRTGAHGLGTEHVLLAMLHPDTGAARPLLAAYAVTLEPMRQAVAVLGSGARGGSAS